MGGSLSYQLQSAINAATMLMPPAVNSDDADLLNLDWDQISHHSCDEERFEDRSEELEDHQTSRMIEEAPET
jgi:hypothetical protein